MILDDEASDTVEQATKDVDNEIDLKGNVGIGGQEMGGAATIRLNSRNLDLDSPN